MLGQMAKKESLGCPGKKSIENAARRPTHHYTGSARKVTQTDEFKRYAYNENQNL